MRGSTKQIQEFAWIPDQVGNDKTKKLTKIKNIMKIKKGDNVMVMTGKDKGKKGAVVRAFPKENKVLLDGVNVAKKHMKKGKKGSSKGQIVERPMPINVSNVMIVEGGKPTRIGYKMEAGKKVRIAKKSNKELK